MVFDFGPNPAFVPKSVVESFAQRLVGVAWVDEQAHDVARLEARLNDSLKIAGGLFASVQQGSNFAFEQELVNNEVWLPSYAEVHATGRFLLLKGFRQNVRIRYSDYKRFNVETATRPFPSSAH